MAEPQPERRSSRRFALRLPLTVTYPDGPQEGVESESRDVSARGICFYFESAPATGTDIEFTLVLPPEITATDSIHVHCKGRVVRVDRGLPSGRLEVAAVIHEYEFLPEA
jgi:PilZ domain